MNGKEDNKPGIMGSNAPTPPRSYKQKQKLTATDKIDLDPNKDPWEWQIGETKREYELFQGYLLTAVIDPKDWHPPLLKRNRNRYAEKVKNKNVRNMHWLNRWKERADAYDQHMVSEAFLADQRAIQEMNKLHASAGRALLQKGLQAIMQKTPQEISSAEAVSMTREGTKIERLARGETTENTGIKAEMKSESTLDLSGLSTEELKALILISEKLSGSGNEKNELEP